MVSALAMWSTPVSRVLSAQAGQSRNPALLLPRAIGGGAGDDVVSVSGDDENSDDSDSDGPDDSSYGSDDGESDDEDKPDIRTLPSSSTSTGSLPPTSHTLASSQPSPTVSSTPPPTRPSPVDPKPVAFPVSTSVGDEDFSDDSDGDDSDDEDETDAPTLPSNSDSAAGSPSASSSPRVPAGNAGATSLPSSSSDSSEASGTDPEKHTNIALVASLATIGALLTLLALLCLVRRYFITRRRRTRDAWTSGLSNFVESKRSDYGSYISESSMGTVQTGHRAESDERRGLDMPTGWVDVEKADPLSPPRPLFVTNPTTTHAPRQSGVSIESYGNLTREPLTYHRPSSGYPHSLSSDIPRMTSPPAAVMASRWSSSNDATTTYATTSRGSMHSLGSFKSVTIEGMRFVNVAQPLPAYRQPSIMLEPKFILSPAASITSVPHSSIYGSDTFLPTKPHENPSTSQSTYNPLRLSWVHSEGWTGAVSPGLDQTGSAGHGKPTINVTPASNSSIQSTAPRKSLSGQSQFASSSDHEQASMFSV
ncbi:hypothetical protein BKA62DRAFT_489551 [Auriculariales sp. MPI-PUGE-AT-0066]|nr:hypothetical protein BKA62DRAFT_489551 [Auriculariales sp. MPI-PUGE-AT-0066]